jgi:hypothetical protein
MRLVDNVPTKNAGDHCRVPNISAAQTLRANVYRLEPTDRQARAEFDCRAMVALHGNNRDRGGLAGHAFSDRTGSVQRR